MGGGLSRASRPRIRHTSREVAHSVGDSPERISVLGVVALLESAAEPEDCPAAGDVVECARHVRDQIGVSVADAVHEGPKTDPRGGRSPPGEHSPAFKARHVGVPRSEEVVPVEQGVGAECIGLAGSG
jgi:hypothetical protein